MAEQLPYRHAPVLAAQLLDGLATMPQPGCLLDCTLGGAGHSGLLLAAHPALQLLGLDQDASARAAALAPFPGRWQILADNFGTYQPPTSQPFCAVIADLGVSSPQLDVAERGFSFRRSGPVDMRMNQEQGETAAELLNRLSEAELADLIHTCGEERRARRIARRLVAQRPFADTARLAWVIAGAFPPGQRHGGLHPATRTFQALRIAVNRELDMLTNLLQRAPAWLMPGGLMAVISFHSLEDRLVKQAFRNDTRLERLTRKPLVAAAADIAANPRSRSAKLCIARKL